MILDIPIIRGVLNWFYYNSEKTHSYQSIERVLNRAAFSIANQQSNSGTQKTFYALLRWGLIEHVGENHFRISPTAGIFHEHTVLIFHNPIRIAKALEPFKRDSHIPGICFYNNSKDIIKLCELANIQLVKFNLNRLICQIPKIGDLIYNWQKELIIETTGFRYFNQRSEWVSFEGKITKPGVYSKSENIFASKVLCISDNEWKKIPERNQQYDGFTVAVLQSRIQNKIELGITYNKKLELLSIRTSFFPIIIERLLFINTLLSSNPNVDTMKRMYHIDWENFCLINNIFHNAIESK